MGEGDNASRGSAPRSTAGGWLGRFTAEHITAIVAIATVIVTVGQCQSQALQSERSLALQEQSANGDRDLQREIFERDWKLRFTTFLADHLGELYSPDTVASERMKQMILVSYPDSALATLFAKLAAIAPDSASRRRWTQEASRASRGEYSSTLGLISVHVSDEFGNTVPGVDVFATHYQEKNLDSLGNYRLDPQHGRFLGKSEESRILSRGNPSGGYVVWATFRGSRGTPVVTEELQLDSTVGAHVRLVIPESLQVRR